MVSEKVISISSWPQRLLLQTCVLIFCFTAQGYAIDALGLQEVGFTSVDVSSQIDAYATFENHPLQGTVSIVHNVKQEVDPNSFSMNQTALKADLIKNVSMPAQPNVVLSIYQFELPGQPKGLYVLPAISVKVGGTVYTSIPSTYEVSGAAPAPKQTPAVKATLTLQSTIDAPPTLYPGSIVNFNYRYLYTGDIELTTESLPLIDPKGFQKIGEKKVTELLQDNVSVRQVSQQAKAVAPGVYNYPASTVEGYAYIEEGPLKKRTYLQPKLQSETQPVSLTVYPFPAKGKPASFNGAVGEFTFSTNLITPSTVEVDEKMQLSLNIEGVANLSDVAMPPLTQLKSLFRFSDLPPAGQIDNSTERYIVDLYPLSTAIKEIPSIEFSYLEPLSGHYVTLESNPIPITITSSKSNNSAPPVSSQTPPANVSKPSPATPIQQPQPVQEHVQQQPTQKPPLQQPSTPPQPSPSQTTPIVQKPAAVEIESVYILFAADLENLVFGTWDILWIIPLGGFLIAFQLWLKNHLLKRTHMVKRKTSQELFTEAMTAPFGSPEFFTQLNQALLLRLVERGEIQSTEVAPDDLPKTGMSGEVRKFLNDLEEKRFTGKGVLDEATVKTSAKQLFNQLSNA